MPDTRARILSPTDIETAAVAELVARMDMIRKAAVQKGMRYIFNNPAVTASIFESGEFIPEGQQSYRIPAILHVQIAFTNAKGEQDRIEGINPLVMGVILALMHKDLGLRLKSPGLVPRRFRDVSTDKDFKENKIVYDVEFACSWTIEPPNDDDDADLLTIGLTYFLIPGDDVADAEDIVTLTGGEPS
jgi:hypothetical protein